MVPSMSRNDSDQGQAEGYSDEETAQRRDAVVRRMLATPPKPHEPLKKAKRRKASVPPKERSRSPEK